MLQIRFDHGPDGAAATFAQPRTLIDAREIADVPDALQALDRARAEGAWLAGFASYELGYALEPRLQGRMPQERRLPLLRFGVYDSPPQAAPAIPPSDAALSDMRPAWEEVQYAKAFQIVHDYIGAGDIYQANLTFPLRMQATGGAQALYAALARLQPVRFGCTCSEDRVRNSLSIYSAKDIEKMTTEEGIVTADCQFCGAHYRLDPATLGFDAENPPGSDE